MNVITDVDGVLLDWESAFEGWMTKHRNVVPNHSLSPNTYNMEDKYGLKDQEILSHINEFNATVAFGHLAPVRDALEVVPGLLGTERFDWFWLSCARPDGDSDGHETAIRRFFNIKDVFGYPMQGLCLKVRESKVSALKTFDPHKSVFIEDSLAHAMEGARAGFCTFLLDYPYNQTPNKMPNAIVRVRSWADIQRKLDVLSPPELSKNEEGQD